MSQQFCTLVMFSLLTEVSCFPHAVAMFLPFIILRKDEKRKMKTSTRLTKENPMQRPRVPPMFAMKVVTDITWLKRNKDLHFVGGTLQ